MEGSGTTSANAEIKDISKVTTSSENREILLKGTTENVINTKKWFLASLIRVGISLTKNVLAPLAKKVLLPLGGTVLASAKIQLFKRKFIDWAWPNW